MIVLETSEAKVSINPIGSELTSFIDKTTNLEYIWQAGDIWPKSAPILFPIVGALKNESYTFNDKVYHLGRHGFARETSFSATKKTNNEVTLSLFSNENTRSVYPFDFCLEIHWSLKGKLLESSYKIINTDNQNIFYSFGLHPAFTLCFEPSQGIETMLLELPTDEEWISTAGLNPDSTHYEHIQKLGRKTLPLSASSFLDDALIFENLQSRSLKVKSSVHSHYINLIWSENLDILGIWSKPTAPFICVEPWAGICDHQDATGNLTQKKAIRQLLPGKEEIFSFSAEIF
ncbi:MAG: aldose 1-epimerase family protein [Brevinema sp.]